jgi:curved DNA-binding protein CbpA
MTDRSMDKQEACRLLNLPPDPPPTPEQVRHAYRKLAQKYHPDRNPDKVANDIFVSIDRAYKFLAEGPAPRPAPQQSAPPAQQSAPASSASRSEAWRKQHEFQMAPEVQRMLDNFCGDLQGYPELRQVKLAQLQAACAKNGIKLDHISKRTQRSVKKSKGKLYQDIMRLPQFETLKRESYEQLLDTCKEKQIPLALTVRGRQVNKSVVELILDLLCVI